jgi:hypothetical protein
MKTTLMLEVFDHLRLYCVNHGIGELIYKTIPHLYCRLPSDEDRYALYVNGGEVIARQLITAIDQRARLPFAHGRVYGIKKASKAGVQINASDDLARYWAILGEVLQTRHQADPVHTLSEISLLRERFPDNIRLYAASIGSDIVAGVLMYVSDQVARTQYIAANEQAKRLGALDLLLDHLINKEYAEKRYFDFGSSYYPGGAQLNFGLIKHKEAFGGRAFVSDTYRLRI